MKHLTEKDLLDYVTNAMVEKFRNQIESHLYMCDDCLEKYIAVLNKAPLPSLNNTSSFTDNIMLEIEKEKGKKNYIPVTEETKERAISQRTVVHYIVACAMTIIFMTTGVFEGFTSYVQNVHAATISEDKPSITEQIIETIYSDKNERKEE